MGLDTLSLERLPKKLIPREELAGRLIMQQAAQLLCYPNAPGHLIRDRSKPHPPVDEWRIYDEPVRFGRRRLQHNQSRIEPNSLCDLKTNN